MQKKLAASFLAVACLYAVVAVVVPRLQHDPFWSFALTVSLDLVIGLSGAVLLSHLLTRRLRALAAVAREFRHGDLTPEVDTRGRDETAELARAFAGMQESLVLVVSQVRETAGRVNDSAIELSGASQRMGFATENIAAATAAVAHGAEDQALQVRRTSERTRELAAAVAGVAQAALTVRGGAEDAAARAEAGLGEARRAAQGIHDVAAKTGATAAAVEGFQRKADAIGRTIASISSLTQQTHLLAINAAIEAARAGEEARGFGVVADEVRRLADDVTGFAATISTLSDEIQDGARVLADAIRVSQGAAVDARATVAAAEASFDEILEAVRATAGRVGDIAELTQTQRDAARDVDEALATISNIAARNAASSEETSQATGSQTESMRAMAASAHALAQASDELKALIAVFKT